MIIFLSEIKSYHNKKFVDFDKTKLNLFNYYDYAMDSSKPSTKKFYLNNFLHASGSSLKGGSFKD